MFQCSKTLMMFLWLQNESVISQDTFLKHQGKSQVGRSQPSRRFLLWVSMSFDGLLSFWVCGSWASVPSKRVYLNSHSLSGQHTEVAIWDAKKTQDNLVLYLQHFHSAQPLKPQLANQNCSVSNTGQFLVEASVSDFNLLPHRLLFVLTHSLFSVSHISM